MGRTPPSIRSSNLGSIRRVTDLRGWARVVGARDLAPSWANDPTRSRSPTRVGLLAGSGRAAWYWDMEFVQRDRPAPDPADDPHANPAPHASRSGSATDVANDAARFLAERLPSAARRAPGGEDSSRGSAIREAASGRSRSSSRCRARRARRGIAPSPPCCSPTSWAPPTPRPSSATARGRDLVQRHHDRRARAISLRYRGREIDTAGDGFFATFDGPARGGACAQEIVDALPRARGPRRASTPARWRRSTGGRRPRRAIGARIGRSPDRRRSSCRRP